MIPVFILFTAGPLYSAENESYAVLLGGGGARGAYEIGVWKALNDMDIEIGAVYGVSVGAINGAVLVAGEYSLAENLWLHIRNDNVMVMTDSVESLLEGSFSFSALTVAAENFISEGGIDVSPLEDLLDRYIDEQAVRNSSIEFGLASYSLSDMTEKYYYLEDIPEGELVEYILASANFPLFQRQMIGGEKFVDGGIYKNLVIDMVDPARFSKVLAVSLDLLMPGDIIDFASDYKEYEHNVEFISPSFDPGSLLDFKPENALRLMQMGYLDCLRHFGKISGSRYYIYGEGTIRQMFESLSSEQRKTAVELLEIPAVTEYEKILPELRKMAGSEAELLEVYAVLSGIEREDLFSEQELISKIVDKYINRFSYKVYYDRYLDFLSYLALESDYKYRPDEELSRYIDHSAGFQE